MSVNTVKAQKMERAYSIIKEYSLDSQHYLSFKEENSFFFGEGVDGLISYVLVGKKAMSIGDPVCKFEDMEYLTGEYINFCNKMGWKPIFNSVSGYMAEILRKLKFPVLKYGEEAILDLSRHRLAESGRSTALRRNVSKVENSGVTLREYYPQQERNYALEKEISNLSEKWYSDKKYEMNFSIGSLNFDAPYDRRFFVTTDADGFLLTFLSFLPYEGGRNYCIDIMYRKMDAMTGVMEHAIIAVAKNLKKEGVCKVSLGIAPLAGIDGSNKNANRAEKLMSAIFYSKNLGYSFENLYRFKRKFDPTVWEPRYLVYHRKIPLVDLAITITNTKRGTTDLALYAKCKFFLVAVNLGIYKVEAK